jgi:hypothetical protein
VLLPATPTAPGRLTVALDLLGASEDTWHLRVVNPDRVISNSRPLDVFLPPPTVSSVTPGQVLSGEAAVLTVEGTGLGVTSQCFIDGPAIEPTGLATVPADPPTTPPTLKCTIDATLFASGSGYEIFVRNLRPPAAPLESGRRPFAIVSPVPAITDVSPSAGQAGTVIAVTITGTGFDASSTVVFDGADIGSSFVDATQIFVAQLSLPGCASASCDHTLVVRNGTVSSNAFTVRAGGTPAQVVAVSPGTGYQGEQVVVTFNGSGFVAGTVVQAAEPSGSFGSSAVVSTTVVGPTEVQGNLDLTGKPEGQWLLRLLYPDGSSSTTFSFRVLSNQAILFDAVPRGGAQGEVKSVTLTVGNLRPPAGGVRVRFKPPDPAPAEDLAPDTTTATTITVTLNLVGRETGGCSLQVLNPGGASPSNALSFNVTPGPPTLASVACTSIPPCSTATSTPRSDTPATVVLTGTNFAKPDSGGTGGSSVHISAPDLGVTDFTVPSAATTVASPTQIVIQLDTRNGVSGAYDVAVWNPGGPTPPQKSNVLQDGFQILP